MIKIWFLIFLILTVSCGKGMLPKVDFNNAPLPISPDYAMTKNWAALPEMIDSADVAPKGLTNNQATAKVDVFFIHPTTYKGKQWNASLDDEKTNLKTDSKPIKYQASIFNGSCKVYAPRYRQATLQSFYKRRVNGQKALDLAYQDVRAAFEYYLENYNKRRPFVIATHSQGTRHGVRLMQEMVDSKPIQDQLVAAYLVGFAVDVNAFENIPICNSANQTNCYVSWNTYQDGFLPKFYDPFYNSASVVNPVSWTTDSTSINRSQHQGAVLKKFDDIKPNLFDTRIANNILWITKPDINGKFFVPFKNYHVGDYNLFYMNVRENVATRVRNYLEIHED